MQYSRTAILCKAFLKEFCYVGGQQVRNLTVMKLLGARVRELRLNKGYTMEDLADEAGLSYSQIARIETGKLNTTISTIHAIAKALQTTDDELLKYNKE